MVAAAEEKTARRRSSARNFYRHSVSEAEQIALGEAAAVEGLDDEIALLRVRLRRALGERPEDMQLLVRGLDLLVKAVATRYRLSPRARRDLAENLAGVLSSLGDQLLPPA
ncbi:MAG TPA: hypothetical protein VFT91_09135 [Dehalococcoidia bacterium]|nr:hypothetical protein [Dehalococcoidia bacterium]